jgi:uncharacterized damage-inducible protein DinB
MDATLQYPIGKFQWNGSITDEQRRTLIDAIEQTPAALRAAVHGMSPDQLDTPYRPGGWTVRQVVHHLPDSHLNSYVRFKLALTETDPVIKPYDEALWAELPDSRSTPVEVSLTLLESLHQRWVVLLRSLSAQDGARSFRHPERGAMSLDQTIALYAWHGRHHAAHITTLREHQGWNGS